jgi:predicted nucleotidyltransferase
MKEINSEMLEEVTSRIVGAVHPEKIVLFGSHVWGRPTDDSDIDLMVIVDRSEQPGYRLARDIYRSLRGLRVPVEVVVRTRDEMARGLAVKTSLERRVLEEGRVLHG